MWQLIHGNGTLTAGRGMSLQFEDRVSRAINRYWNQSLGPVGTIEKICFFAVDEYEHITAADYLRERCKGIPEDHLLIAPTAASTVDEMRHFAAAIRESGGKHAACVSTSAYHVFRSSMLAVRYGVLVNEWTVSPVADYRDVLQEPFKLMKDSIGVPLHARQQPHPAR